MHDETSAGKRGPCWSNGVPRRRDTHRHGFEVRSSTFTESLGKPRIYTETHFSYIWGGAGRNCTPQIPVCVGMTAPRPVNRMGVGWGWGGWEHPISWSRLGSHLIRLDRVPLAQTERLSDELRTLRTDAPTQISSAGWWSCLWSWWRCWRWPSPSPAPPFWALWWDAPAPAWRWHDWFAVKQRAQECKEWQQEACSGVTSWKELPTLMSGTSPWLVQERTKLNPVPALLEAPGSRMSSDQEKFKSPLAALNSPTSVAVFFSSKHAELTASVFPLKKPAPEFICWFLRWTFAPAEPGPPNVLVHMHPKKSSTTPTVHLNNNAGKHKNVSNRLKPNDVSVKVTSSRQSVFYHYFNWIHFSLKTNGTNLSGFEQVAASVP